MAILTILLFVTKLSVFFSKFSAATDTITQFEPLEDNTTLVSKDGTFELGLFTPGTVLLTNNPEEVLFKGSTEYYRSGPSQGPKFSGNPSTSNSVANYTLVSNNDGYYITYSITDKSVISRILLNQTLYLRQRLTWNKDSQSWRVSSQLPSDLCDVYNTCGAFGVCDINLAPVCNCLDGFKPKVPQNWSQMNWNEGCVHNQTWRCRGKGRDGFMKYEILL
ncbi:hypothetical protein VNO78_06350 [Psophocarpus tetragonolobus]|uniref:S-locus glycoprotein domain-containing protein n=1 Tax=Psophocarpus tetragonolobus TaxID=3891 RepID=A0AAN9STH6_PSOTE